MKESHLTLRLPTELARALARWAKARGLPKSQVARDAVAQYLAPPPGDHAGAVNFSARDLAERWSTLPRLQPDEADLLAADIAAGRADLPPVTGSWD